MRQVFISYSSKDLSQARAVRNVLEQNEITCWMAPADIPGGSNYTKEIPIAIKGCQAFVLMLPDNAQHSQWVLKELDSAVNAGKTILPFQIEDVPLSDEFNFLLTGAQRYDAYQKKTEALQMLVARIKAIIAATPGEAPAPKPEPKAEEQPVFTIKSQPAAEALGIHVCPACGSVDVQDLPGRVKPRDLKEHLLKLAFALAMTLLTPFATLILCATLLTILEMLLPGVDPDIFEAMGVVASILTLAAFVVGFRLGSRMADERIRRMRIRSHTTVTECRCNTCQKKFQSVTVDGVPVK